MPDVNGVLTQEERAKVDIWFKKNWATPPKCPMCNSRYFILADHVVMPTVYSQTSAFYIPDSVPIPSSISSTNYPQIMLMCDKCGFILHFNAVKVGLWETQNVE